MAVIEHSRNIDDYDLVSVQRWFDTEIDEWRYMVVVESGEDDVLELRGTGPVRSMTQEEAWSVYRSITSEDTIASVRERLEA